MQYAHTHDMSESSAPVGRQATVQAALAASPMDAVNIAYPDALDSRGVPVPRTPESARYHQFAEDALVTGVFCIVICSAVGTLLIRWFAPVLLEHARARPRLGLR